MCAIPSGGKSGKLFIELARDRGPTREPRARIAVYLCVTVVIALAAFGRSSAEAATILPDLPVATISADCSVRLTDKATFDPATGFTEADWYINGVGIDSTFPGPGGTVMSAFSPGTVPAGQMFNVYVTWEGSGLAYPGSKQSPTLPVQMPATCSSPPVAPTPPASSHSQGYRDNMESARDLAAVGAVLSCSATALGGLAYIGAVFGSGGVAAAGLPWATGLLQAGGLACLGALSTFAGSSYLLANDPPDDDYKDIALPVPAAVPGDIGGCAPGASSAQCNDFTTAQSAYSDAINEVLGLLESSSTATNRFGSAISAQDDESADLQASVNKVLEGEMVSAFAAQHQAGLQLVSALRAAEVPMPSIDLDALTNLVAGSDLSSDVSDVALPLVAPFGAERATLASELKQVYLQEAQTGAGSSYTQLGDLVSVDYDTSGFESDYRSLTADDATRIVTALASQGDVTALEDNTLTSDITAYGDTQCSEDLVADAGHIADASARAFVLATVRGLVSTCPDAPAISGVTPASGSLDGGTSVTIAGTDLASATEIEFGSTPATNVTCDSSLCTATAPAGTGSVDVTAVTPDGTTPAYEADEYTYVDQSRNLLSDGDFEPANGVPDADGDFVATSYPSTLGAWTVSASDGDSRPGGVETVSSDLAQAYGGSQFLTFGEVDLGDDSGAAQISQTVPVTAGHLYELIFALSGDPNGGDPLKGLTASVNQFSSKLVFDDSSYSRIYQGWRVEQLDAPICNETSATVAFQQDQPGDYGPEIDDVRLVDEGPSSQCTTLPSITGLSPGSGSTAGGEPLTVAGINLAGVTAATVGGKPATNLTCDVTTCHMTTPTGSGVAEVRLMNASGSSASSSADQFTYVAPDAAPVVSSLAPGSGPIGGGTIVSITGLGLGATTSVMFGAQPATSLACDPGTCLATAPAGNGTVDVRVDSPNGVSAVTPNDRYTYTPTVPPTPAVSAIDPTSGPAAGGTTVTIDGQNLAGVTKVLFGSNPATAVSCTSASCTAVSPAGVGTVDVTVQSPGGTSSTSTADHYTYTRRARHRHGRRGGRRRRGRRVGVMLPPRRRAD